MLLELSKKDKIWREIAFKICGDHSKADDLVQEMYLKLYSQKKQINSGYIYATLRSIFIECLSVSASSSVSINFMRC